MSIFGLMGAACRGAASEMEKGEHTWYGPVLTLLFLLIGGIVLFLLISWFISAVA